MADRCVSCKAAAHPDCAAYCWWCWSRLTDAQKAWVERQQSERV